MPIARLISLTLSLAASMAPSFTRSRPIVGV
jgi:hypothetical protein